MTKHKPCHLKTPPDLALRARRHEGAIPPIPKETSFGAESLEAARHFLEAGGLPGL